MSDFEQDWVRQKNNNAGSSLVDKARQTDEGRLQFGSAPFEGMNQRVLFPEVDQTRLPGFLIRGVLSKEECVQLISQIPHEGEGYLSPDQIRRLYRGRIVHRYMARDRVFADMLEARIGSMLPRYLDDDSLEFSGISDEFRYLHYEINGHQDCHIDGRYTHHSTELV